MLDINKLFLEGISDRDKITVTWKSLIASMMTNRELNNKLVLPPIIFSEKDFDIIHPYMPRPNFITQKKIKGKLIKLKKVEKPNIKSIEGNIIMIENADPGYDWIFTRNPAGLITKYGGVASHMSIRCAEFGIPAAIGCGFLFDQLSYVSFVVLDCKQGKITPIGGRT